MGSQVPGEVFSCGLRYIEENRLALADAVQQSNCLRNKSFLCFS